MAISEQYKIIASIYIDNAEKINELIKRSKFPMAFEALQNFVSKINELKTALEALEKAKAFYSSQGLTRVLHEHFLVAFYIWIRCRIENNDECAVDYMRHYPVFEMIKRVNYDSRLDKSFDAKKTPLENFLLKNPEFKAGITEADILEINTKANKFDIRNILKFMQNELDEADAFKAMHPLILGVCREYNEILSYVHAGRLADMQTFENTPATNMQDVMNRNASLGIVYAQHVMSFIMLLLAIEFSEFADTYRDVIYYIDEIKNR